MPVKKKGEWDIRLSELTKAYWAFDEYMTTTAWDGVNYGEGLYRDEALYAISMFIEFCDQKMVTDDEGDEIER